MKFLSLVFSNLKRKKLRTILTVLSIFVAFILFGALCIIKQALTGGVSMAGVDRLMVSHKMSFIQSLPVAYQARILAIPGVAACSHISWFGGYYKEEKNVLPSFPVDPDSYFAMFPELSLPADQMAAWKQKRNGIVIGKTTMDRFAKSDGWKIGSTISLISPIWQREGGNQAWEFEIVGIYDTVKKGADSSQVLFRYDYFDEGRAINKGEIGWFSVRVQNPDQAPDIAKRIDAEFANSPYETKAETEAAAMKGWAAQIGDIGTIVVAVLSTVFFTILLVVGNTMGQSIRERTEEIGVLKAIGFTNTLVLILVIVESCIIAAIGGLLGLIVAKLIAAAGSPVPEMLPVFDFAHRDLLIGILLVLLLGIVSGTFPALQAMRLQIATALRRNG